MNRLLNLRRKARESGMGERGISDQSQGKKLIYEQNNRDRIITNQ